MLLRHEPGIILSLLPNRDSNLLATQAFHVSLTLSTDLGHTMYPVSVGRQSHSLSSLGFLMSAYEMTVLYPPLLCFPSNYYYIHNTVTNHSQVSVVVVLVMSMIHSKNKPVSLWGNQGPIELFLAHDWEVIVSPSCEEIP